MLTPTRCGIIMVSVLVAFMIAPGTGHTEANAASNPFAIIQDPRAQAIIREYLDILTDNPKLQQQVMGCAVDQINQSPEVQEILGVDPGGLQQSVQKRKIDMKKTLLTVKQVFQPCLEILNRNVEIN